MVKEYWERNISETIIDLLEPAIGRRINIVIRSAADDNDEPSNQAAENTLNTEAEEPVPAASPKKASNNNFVHNNQLNTDYTFEKFVVGNGKQNGACRLHWPLPKIPDGFIIRFSFTVVPD